MRKETDALGDMLLPDSVYYGIQTERARQNFGVSGRTIGDFPRYLWCMASIKKAAATANCDIGALAENIKNAICLAADEVMNGQMKNQFPIDVFQGGGGTSRNMNLNEVIANRANEIITGRKGYDRVHPNNHVNMCQSTNDVTPSALKMTSFYLLNELRGKVKILEDAVGAKAVEFRDVVKIGRTCLQDAVPVTLGQEFSGYLSFIKRQRKALAAASQACLKLPLGATAVGTGLGTFPGYTEKVYDYLQKITGQRFTRDENFFDGLQNADIYIRVSSALKSLAAGLSKMATDFRILSSGPRAGISELELPALQPGSSIMPGKINPVMPELINQVCYQIYGNDVAIAMSVEGGELDLNVWEPVIMKCLFESSGLLIKSIPLFAEKCIMGLKANTGICRKYAESSTALSTVISSSYGYKTGSELAKKAREKNWSIKKAAVEMGILTQKEADKLIEPLALTDPAQSRRKIFKAARGRDKK